MTIKKTTDILTENEKRKGQKTRLRPYISPRLSVFGSILTTAGGTGSVLEVDKSGMGNPSKRS